MLFSWQVIHKAIHRSKRKGNKQILFQTFVFINVLLSLHSKHPVTSKVHSRLGRTLWKQRIRIWAITSTMVTQLKSLADMNSILKCRSFPHHKECNSVHLCSLRCIIVIWKPSIYFSDSMWPILILSKSFWCLFFVPLPLILYSWKHIMCPQTDDFLSICIPQGDYSPQFSGMFLIYLWYYISSCLLWTSFPG